MIVWGGGWVVGEDGCLNQQDPPGGASVGDDAVFMVRVWGKVRGRDLVDRPRVTQTDPGIRHHCHPAEPQE